MSVASSYLICTIFAITNCMVSYASLLESKVIGGEKVKLGERGYVVSLRINQTHFGGGCLISNYHILTAGQCVCRIKKDGGPGFRYATVLIGTNDLFVGGTSCIIKRINYHHKYDCNHQFNTTDYDVGLIQLESSIRDVNAYSLPLKFGIFYTGLTFQLIGWSLKTSRNESTSWAKSAQHILRVIDVQSLSPLQCKKVYPFANFRFCQGCVNTHPEYVTDSGDIGNPLILTSKEKAPLIVGIATGVVRYFANYPLRFTRAQYFKKYMEGVLKYELKIDK